MNRRRTILLNGLAALAGLSLLAACPPPPPLVDGGTAFDDHTVPLMATTDVFFERAAAGPSSSAVKFVVTDFSEPIDRGIRWYDSTFFTLHDEWYWYSLLNGVSPAGDDFFEPIPGSFETVDDIYTWARDQLTLPFDLRFVAGGDRLYSPRFYEVSLSVSPRLLGAGTLVSFPADAEAGRAEVWAVELEYTDNVTHEELVVFIDMVLSSIPPAVAPELKWLVRSTAQETLALRMESQQLQHHERIIRYSDVTTPGQTEVYAEGLTAGRLLSIRPTEGSLEDATSSDLLMLEEIPDYLPPCAGLITAVPQTPLAHINVLARNRGIPNVFLAGLFDDPYLDQLGRVRARVAMRARAPDQLDVVAMSDSDWQTWRAISRPPEIVLEPLDLASVPYTLNLEELALDDVDELRPLIGGKAAGFLALLAPGDVVFPELPLAITARAYAEHLEPLRPTLQAAMLEEDFSRSAQTRVLVLEGETAYDVRFPSEADQAQKAALLEAHPAGTPIGDLVAAGGVTGWVRAAPLAAATRELLDDVLRERFAAFAPTQGLRFRSSSTVEDIEGFNGAGLYTSNTGFLDPGPASRGIEEALKRTWASYWGTEAYEERELAGVEHTLGHMAVLVHARFDDEQERSNGVFTLTLLPDNLEGVALLEVNAQIGALSVTNPPPGVNALPEVDRVLLLDSGDVSINRVSPSSELSMGQVVLTDGQLQELLFAAVRVNEAWLAEENADLLSAQRRSVLTLDYEYREMDTGWPALANGNNFPRRLVVKQARSLEPSVARIPGYVRSNPIPRDILARARRVERRECNSVDVGIILVETFTDPLFSPDLGYSEAPHTAFVTLDFNRDVPELGKEAGDRTSLVHLSFDAVSHPGMEQGGPWRFEATVAGPNQSSSGISRIEVDLARDITLEGLGGSFTAHLDTCSIELQYSSPEAFLAGIFDEYDANQARAAGE